MVKLAIADYIKRLLAWFEQIKWFKWFNAHFKKLALNLGIAGNL